MRKAKKARPDPRTVKSQSPVKPQSSNAAQSSPPTDDELRSCGVRNGMSDAEILAVVAAFRAAQATR